MDFQPGEVIYIDFPHPSFKWANGLKVVLEIRDTELLIASINEQGNLDYFENGKLMYEVTGINNKGIFKTNLNYNITNETW